MSQRKSIRRAVRHTKSEDKKLRSMMAGDSFTNFAAKLGLGTDNISSGGTYSFNPITRVRQLLEWIHRGSWLGGVAVDIVADDMTRAGITLKGELKPEKIEQLEETAVALGVWTKLNETIKWARLYGGCLGYIMIDGQDTKTPLRIETVGKGQFKGIFNLDRWMVEPSLNELVTELGPFLGQPKYYTVTAQAPALSGKKIHYTRLIRLTGINLPYWQSMTENLWGLSVLERLYDRMVAFDSATTGAAQLVYKAYIRTYKIKGLREIIAAGGASYEGLTRYVDMMRRFQSIEGMTLLDGEDEFEGQSHQAFTGLGEALLQFGQQLAGALQIPLVRLFGQSPAGLNATGESDLITYYDGINQQQSATLKVPTTLVYRAMAQSEGIKLPEGFGITFNPLWQLKPKEKGELAKTVTDTIAVGVESGLVSQQTAMRELKQSSHDTGIWSNITDKEIAQAEEDLPPGPSELNEQAQASEVEQEGSTSPESKGKKKPTKDEGPTGEIGTPHLKYVVPPVPPADPHKGVGCGTCIHFRDLDQGKTGTCDHPNAAKDADEGFLPKTPDGKPIVQIIGCSGFWWPK